MFVRDLFFLLVCELLNFDRLSIHLNFADPPEGVRGVEKSDEGWAKDKPVSYLCLQKLVGVHLADTTFCTRRLLYLW